jgi:aminoglycoside phosphotransferase family enzyme
VRAVDLVETHISWVLLTGRFAYKIKRPVQYPFIDLRRGSQRRRLCHGEVRLNRRFAPELYLGVRAIRRRQCRMRLMSESRKHPRQLPIDRRPRAAQGRRRGIRATTT